MDTGAQQSILSSSLAFALGLDRNHNGTLEDEAVGTIPIGGIGGTVEILELELDGLSLRTAAGIDLRWNHLTVGVIDIDPQIPGVFGMDLLTSGWFNKVFLGFGDDGFLNGVDYDFRNGGDPAMYLTINSQLDHVTVPEPTSLFLAGMGLAGVAWIAGRKRR